MKIGDIVKGLAGSHAVINEDMTKGVIVKTSELCVYVVVIEHACNIFGCYRVKPDDLEIIGHQKQFDRNEVFKILESGNKRTILEFNLRGADLRSADLRGADLSNANLRGADLRYADLRYADLSNANLRGADLRYADLSNANLRGANLDFSCLPLSCKSLRIVTGNDIRLAAQLCYHLCSIQCDDEEFIKMRNSILPFANKFHRVKEYGELTEINIEQK